MGGAFTAVADDGSALFYNPAGISFQKGTRFEMDGFIIKGFFHLFPSSVPPGTVVPKDGYNGNVSPTVQILGNLYFSKDLPGTKWTFGFGAYAPFGLGDNWTSFKDADPRSTKFPGRFAGTRGLIQNIWMQPTFSYRFAKNASIAFGPALAYMHLLLESSILNPAVDGVTFGTQLAPVLLPGVPADQASAFLARLLPEGRSRFAGTAVDPGATVGVLWKNSSHSTSLGASYRTPVTYHVKGKASFGFTNDGTLPAFFPALGAPTLTTLFPNQDITASFTTPGTLNLGFANSSFKQTLFSFDYVYQNYRRFKEIPLNFSQTKDTATPAELRFAFNFKNTYFIRVGAERNLNDKTIVRAGYYYDHSAVPDASVSPFFPDSDKHVLCLGISRQAKNKEFTLFYQKTFQPDRTTNVAANANIYTNGTYKVSIHLIGFGFRFNFHGTTIDTRSN
jgi:long-chain fatty acid transport protein